MLNVKVQYFAAVRELVNLREEAVAIAEEATVEDLLRLLTVRHGEKLREFIFDPKTSNPRPYLQFLLDGRSISATDGLSTSLSEGCIFAIIPPVGGGKL